MRKVLFLIITFLLISNSFVFVIQSKEDESASPQSNFIQNYLGEKGYVENSELTKNFTKNDMVGTITPLNTLTRTMSVEEGQTYSINLKNLKDDAEINFLLKVEKLDNKTILTMFNDEGGVKIDFTNKVILETWSTHNTCSYWTCVGNYIIHMLTDLNFWTECGPVCLSDPTAITCLTCAIRWGATGFWNCYLDKCAWYPCKQDCTDNNWYDSYYNYCSSNELWKHRWHYVYKCPDGVDYGEAGDCISDSSNSGWINNTYVMTCSINCLNGECTGQTIPTTTTTPTSTTTISLEERVKKLEEKVSEHDERFDLLDVVLSKFRDTICKIRYFEDFCKPRCSSPYICSSTCVDDTIPSYCYDRTIHPEYYCSSDKVCCASVRVTCLQNIELQDAYCQNNNIIYSIKNVGNADVISLTFYVDSIRKSATCNPTLPIKPNQTTTCTHSSTLGTHQVRVVGPSNAVVGTVNC